MYIHYGPPDDIPSYVQETGQCGKDGLNSNAVLILKKKILKMLTYFMKDYISNYSDCRRRVLFERLEGFEDVTFEQKCLCCDVCAANCSCDKCKSL